MRHHRRVYFTGVVFAAIIVASFLVGSWAIRSRGQVLDQALYEQCVSNENQDAVIVSILLAIPPQRRSQVIQDAINTLEPPGEPDCTPPKGAFP